MGSIPLEKRCLAGIREPGTPLLRFGCFQWSQLTCTARRDPNNRNFQIFYYYGEDNGRKIVARDDRWIPTGIGMMKFSTQGELYGWTVYRKSGPAIRYADILLLYAEALNELTTSYTVASWDGSETYSISGMWIR